MVTEEVMPSFGNGLNYQPKRISSQRNKIDEFIVDETIFKIGSQHIWLWVAIEPINGQILE
jgi:transposase-like protein